jgi:hypothetical protein
VKFIYRPARLLLAVVFLAGPALMPVSAFAQGQPSDQTSCGVQIPLATGDELMLTQPEDIGQHDQTSSSINYSAVRGSIVHMEGPLVLLQLESAGIGNAGVNHDLAGDNMAVVQLPNQCNPADFPMGSAIMAIGTPMQNGILNAVEVTPTG